MDRDLFTDQAGEPTARFRVAVSELAMIMGVKPVTIHKFVKEGMPKAARGQDDLAECVQWYIGMLRERVMSAASGANTGKRDRYFEAQAARAEQQMELQRGELLRRDEVEGTLTAIAGILASQIDALAPRLAPAAAAARDAAEAQEVIEYEAGQIRSAIASEFERFAVELEQLMAEDDSYGGGDNAPAAPTNGERLGGREAGASAR